MLQEQDPLDITCSNRHQGHAEVDKVISHSIQSARDNIAELHDLLCFESTAEHLESIGSLLADNKYLVHGADGADGGVRGPNATERESIGANEWPAST
jgi:hypothetical protein